MRIGLIHPSRGRPRKAFDTFRNWTNKAGESFDYILSLDSDDPSIGEYQELFKGQYILINDNKSVVQATNCAARRSHGDVIIYLSDDFDCPERWWRKVREEFFRVYKPALLKVDDCLQPYHVRVLTIPMMNRLLYQELGYFWNPLYDSMFVDQDLYEVCEKNRWLIHAPHLKFPHNHVSVGKAPDDETYRRSAANWNTGKATFQRRQQAGFPL